MRIVETLEFSRWINDLRDSVGKAQIITRIGRLADGNPGDHRYLTRGVAELRINFGPGYRVYYARKGSSLILLLAGGDKSTQAKDVLRAIAIAEDFEE